MGLPTHFIHDLGQGSAALPLKHRYDLGGLAALARCAAFALRRLRSFVLWAFWVAS
jgi:hypothetical protein